MKPSDRERASFRGGRATRTCNAATLWPNLKLHLTTAKFKPAGAGSDAQKPVGTWKCKISRYCIRVCTYSLPNARAQ